MIYRILWPTVECINWCVVKIVTLKEWSNIFITVKVVQWDWRTFRLKLLKVGLSAIILGLMNGCFLFLSLFRWYTREMWMFLRLYWLFLLCVSLGCFNFNYILFFWFYVINVFVGIRDDCCGGWRHVVIFVFSWCAYNHFRYAG